jgi:hypothetical protein
MMVAHVFPGVATTGDPAVIEKARNAFFRIKVTQASQPIATGFQSARLTQQAP